MIGHRHTLKGSFVVRLPHLHGASVATAGQDRSRHIPLTPPRIGFQFLRGLDLEFIVVNPGGGLLLFVVGGAPSSHSFALVGGGTATFGTTSFVGIGIGS